MRSVASPDVELFEGFGSVPQGCGFQNFGFIGFVVIVFGDGWAFLVDVSDLCGCCGAAPEGHALLAQRSSAGKAPEDGRVHELAPLASWHHCSPLSTVKLALTLILFAPCAAKPMHTPFSKSRGASMHRRQSTH